MMNQRHFLYIRTIAEERNFSRAAEKLYISQPSLSQSVKRIEAQYGVPLFYRSRGAVVLTAAGERYLQVGEKILKKEQDILFQVQQARDLQRGRLRIGVAPYRDCNILAPAVRAFQRQYPGIEIVLQETGQTEAENGLVAGNLDIALGMPPRKSSNLDFECLFHDRLLLSVSPAHWYFQVHQVQIKESAEGYPVIHLADMAQCDFILLTNRQVLRNMEDDLCAEAGFSPHIVVETKDVAAAHTMAAAGLGAAFLPESFLRFGRLEAPICYYQIDLPAHSIALGILRSLNQDFSPSAARFAAILRSTIQDISGRNAP